MLSAAADTAVEASLHTGNPGGDGSNEISGDDYERQPVSWNSPDDGSVSVADELVFLVPALGSDKVTHVGLWNSDGDWLGDAPASTPQPYPTAGTATVEVLNLNMGNGTLTAQIS